MQNKFAKRLKMIRKEKNVSQVEVGKVLNYGYTAISNYESGRNEPTLTDLCRLADYFDVSADFLLGRTDERYSHYKMEEICELLRGVQFIDIVKREVLQRITKGSID